MSRKKRITMTKSLLIQVQENIKNNVSLKEISKKLLLSYSQVRNIARNLSTKENYIENFKSQYVNRTRSSKVTDITETIKQIIDSKNDISQDQIKEELFYLGYDVSQSTISRAIKKANYSRKRLTRVPVKTNTAQMLEL